MNPSAVALPKRPRTCPIASTLIAALLLATTGAAKAQTTAAPQAGTATATPDNAILLTVFL